MVQTYTHYVFVYKDERRYLFNAFLETTNGQLSNSPWLRSLDKDADITEIAKTIYEAFEYIKMRRF